MPSQTIAITGASGLVGRALTEQLRRAGHSVRAVVRHKPSSPDEIAWTPSARTIDTTRLHDVDVVINLAGENLAQRWTSATRKAILNSRVDATRTVVDGIATTGRPITLINASAVGYYGDRGDEPLDEASSSGRGFLAEVCRVWEAAATGPERGGARTVMLRSGIVLSGDGGALPQMLRPFRFGAGGTIGSGKQWLSWIDREDLVRAIAWLIDHPEIEGPVNTLATTPVRNEEFTAIASDVLHRPAMLHVPAFALELVFGDMARETLLASQRAVPDVLTTAGFEFRYPTIRQSLERIS